MAKTAENPGKQRVDHAAIAAIKAERKQAADKNRIEAVLARERAWQRYAELPSITNYRRYVTACNRARE